ncbi:hypothetical protein [Streptomyces sp. TP-A0874]|uniref:hypothetical protein n=1 Tax=Streptomyces sp. TP-A0874 TaxID=549819 RepID=UPI000852FF40|nr:hypothetical protein [Streptomyces sp. TP-A0874]
MTQSGEDYSGYDDYSDGHSGDDGHGTRTRLPETGDVYGGAKRANRSPRSLLTVVSVVVLLIAAIAFANRSGQDQSDSGSSGGSANGPQPTAPTGEDPVTGSNAGIPSGFPKTEQGAQSAAANYAVVLGSDLMFDEEKRHRAIAALTTSSARDDMQRGLDKAYNRSFKESIGLNADGSAPDGMTFISRTIPVGTKIADYGQETATVEVWSTSLFGLAGEGSTKPVADDWFTITITLKWSENDWRIESHSQKSGPAPVRSDTTASSAKDISEAVENYGGFTYAR